MCGIVGYFGPRKFFPTDNKIKNCLKLMQKKGSDFSEGYK